MTLMWKNMQYWKTGKNSPKLQCMNLSTIQCVNPKLSSFQSFPVIIVLLVVTIAKCDFVSGVYLSLFLNTEYPTLVLLRRIP